MSDYAPGRHMHRPSRLGIFFIGAYAGALVAAFCLGLYLASEGTPEAMVPPLLIATAVMLLGRSFALSVEVSTGGLLAWTLGGFRRIPWDSIHSVTIWTEDTVSLPGGLYTLYTKPLGLPMPYDFIRGVPFGDGVTLSTGRRGLHSGYLAVAEPLIANGREAVASISRRIGSLYPNENAPPLVQRLASSSALRSRWQAAALVYIVAGMVVPVGVVGAWSPPQVSPAQTLLVWTAALAGAALCLCGGGLLSGYVGLARQHRAAQGLPDGGSPEE